MWRSNYPNEIETGAAYTDASKNTSSNKRGTGIYSKDFEIAFCLPLNSETSIFAAEPTAIYKAMQLLKDKNRSIALFNLYVF